MIEFIVGIISGIFTGLGLGGGSVLILFLTLFFNIEQHVAQSTNLVFFITAAIVSIFINFKNKTINFKNSIFIIIFGIIGAFIGANISKNLDVTILRKCFAIFLLLVAVYESYSYYKLYIKSKIRHTKQ